MGGTGAGAGGEAGVGAGAIIGGITMGSGAGPPHGATGDATAGTGVGALTGSCVMGAGAELLRGTMGGLIAGPGAGTLTDGTVMGDRPGPVCAGAGAGASTMSTWSLAVAMEGPAAVRLKDDPLHDLPVCMICYGRKRERSGAASPAGLLLLMMRRGLPP